MQRDGMSKQKYLFFSTTFLKAFVVGCTMAGIFLIVANLITPNAIAGTKLRVSMAYGMVSQDPASMHLNPDLFLANQTLEGLVQLDCSDQPCEPYLRLAESLKVSDDAAKITFKIRKGVKFHHGYGELTSEDAAFSLRRHLDPKMASRGREHVKDIDHVETPDKYTMVIYLKNSSGYSLLRNLAWGTIGKVLCKKAVQELGEKIKLFPVGTGPFYFEKRIPGEKVILRRFDDYWGARTQIEELECWVIAEELVALGALRKGDLDLAPITEPGSYKIAKTIKDTYILESPAVCYHYMLYLNTPKPPLNDIRVRKALMHALDLKKIAKRLGPQVVSWPSALPSAVFASTTEFYNYDYNVEKAKKLLKEAGYPNGFDLNIIYHTGTFLEAIALEVKNYWKEIINVKLDLIERAVFYKTLMQFKHDTALWAYTRFSPALYAVKYRTGSSENYCRTNLPELDAIALKAKTEPNVEQSRRYWREWQKYIVDQAVIVWPATQKSQVCVSNRVKGLTPKSILPYLQLIELKDAYVE